MERTLSQLSQSFQASLHGVFAIRLVAIIFVFLSRSVPFADSSSHYTDSWAVEVRGGRQAADTLAKEHGFLNLGEVSVLTKRGVAPISDIAVYTLALSQA